ncbi:MAG: TonB family protein [bacterium]|nr:TonB family protein [bacterium]
MMECHPERKRLGISFLASLLIHLGFFLFLALLSRESARPAIPEAKKIMVELFEQTIDEAGEKPEEMERVAEKSKVVEKELAPRALPQPVFPPTPAMDKGSATILPSLDEARPDEETKDKPKPEPEPASLVEKIGPAPSSDVLTETEVDEPQEERPLPAVSELIPSYDDLARQAPDSQPQIDVEEGDEVSLNTTDFKYLSYFSKLKDRIQMVWRYPEAAKVTGLQGSLVLKFVLNKDGSLRELKVMRSSGAEILDDAAIKAIRRAAPFYAIPQNLGDVLSIVASFEYELDYYYVK